MYDPERMAQAQTSVRYSVLARTGLDVAAIGTWDPDLLREPRVVVPVDVRALVVPSGSTEATVELPGPLSPGAAADRSALAGPAPFTAGTPRAAGVYLTWAQPDSLLRGSVRDPQGGTGGGLGMAALPDRWAVLRLVGAATPTAGSAPVAVTGWLIDAAAGVVRDLAAGPDGAPVPLPAARALDPSELTGTAGGSLTWTGVHDAAYGRFAWHDPLDDLTADPTLGGALPGGPAGAAATYLVVGWWSTPSLDPLDGIRTEGGLSERTQALGWRIVPGGAVPSPAAGPLARLAGLGVLGVRGRLGDGDPAAFTSTAGAYQAIGATSLARAAARWLPGSGAGIEASTLLHGAVLGVPLPPAGGALTVELRPAPERVTVLAGDHVDDLVAAALTAATEAEITQRRTLERLLTAFSAGLLPRMGDPDGLVEIDEAEHAAAFATVDPQEPPLVDRVLRDRASVPPPQPAPGTVGPATQAPVPAPALRFTATPSRGPDYLTAEPVAVTRARLPGLHVPTPAVSAPVAAVAAAAAAGGTTAPAAGSGNPGSGAAGPRAGTPPVPADPAVPRPAPRRMLPLDPLVGLRGAGRFLGHGTDGTADPDERLACRRGSQVAQRYAGLLDGATLLPTLSSGALPAETLALAREALLLSPHLLAWMAQLAGLAKPNPAPDVVPEIPAQPAIARLGTELGLRFDPTGAYLGKAAAGATLARGDVDGVRVSTLELLRRHSLLDGVEPDPVALTSWAQPWIPLALEWEVAVTPLATLSDWTLGAVDLEPGDALPQAESVIVTGRAALSTGPGTQLAGAITRWSTQEDARDTTGQGETDADTQQALADLSRAAAGLDMLAASLDGVRRGLLGLPADDVRVREADGSVPAPTPLGPPALLVGGTVTLTRLRIVDAFGRTLDLDPTTAVTPARTTLPDQRGTLLRTPRITAPTRLRLRLVGAETVDPAVAADAVVDELDASRQVNPVVGFLLPNHVDEAVQVFGTDGSPLGELLTEPVGGGVVWEPAPGRPLRADAAPGEGLAAAQRPLGLFAGGIVAADAAARAGTPPPEESAVSAFLRAVDTTLWTVDPVAGAGSSAVASIVGNPVAVVRAVVVLDVADDLADLTLTPEARAGRAAAYADLVRLAVGVRVGELTRSDDGVLGWFADDDFTRMHVVDKAVRDLALPRSHDGGRFGPWGTATPPADPPAQPITHPYLDVACDLLVVRPGVPRVVTLLMLPGSAATLTCGLVPRISVRLARAWFAPGLEKLSPSVRIGPVLVDPGDVRLPTVSALGARQVLSHREGPLDWRDDAILAATQAALLPDRAHALREGWIRLDPSPPPGPGSPA